MRVNEKFDGKTPCPHDHSLEVQIPIEMIPLSLTSAQPITVTFNPTMTMDYRHGDSSPIGLIDMVGPFEVRFSGCQSPSVKLQQGDGIYNIIQGCSEFDPNDTLKYFIDADILDGIVKTDDLGCFTAKLPAITGLSPGLHRIDVISQNDSESTGAKSAAAFFSYCPQGHAASDLNGDCVVDLIDFAAFAENWLLGK